MTTGKNDHASLIQRQFTSQARAFANSPVLHSDAVLALMVEAGTPTLADEMLDVACGTGSVVAAYAPLVQRAVGLDSTDAMLEQARTLAADKALLNVAWDKGDVYNLPYRNQTFDIVACRFAFHHLRDPNAAFDEMFRVCRDGGRIVLCDAVACDDPAKADALNDMERFRDPSTVAFRTLAYLEALFAARNLEPINARNYVHATSMRRLLDNSFPLGGDKESLRLMIENSVENDLFGLNARRHGDDIVLEAPVVILSAAKPPPAGKTT